MRASVYHGPRDIRVEDVPDATLQEPTDALVRVTHACICGSDLWPYRGELEIYGRPGRTGHEFMGVVEAVGADVRTLRPGQRVIAPFAYSDGTCDYCAQGLQTSCRHGRLLGRPGRRRAGRGGARAARRRHPRPAARRRGPLRRPPRRRPATLTDVMGTGHHGALNAGVAPGATAVVVGDGAVGLCAVLAARGWRRADHRPGPPRRPPGDRARLRRHRRGGRARRRGRRAGCASSTDGGADARGRGGRRGQLVRGGDRRRPARRHRRPRRRPALQPGEPRAGAHAEHPPARRRRPGARPTSRSCWRTSSPAPSTRRPSSTGPSPWRRSRRATRRWTTGPP